jgi:hypothetical protein
MNINRKVQLAAAAVIVNSSLALGLLASRPAFASGCGVVEECTTGSYCATHTNNKYCPPQFGCRYSGQTACIAPENYGSCAGFYSYICIYVPT